MWLRLVIGIVVIYLLYRLVKRSIPDKRPLKRDIPLPGEDLVEDPVCHAYVPVSLACHILTDGKIIYFCSNSCLEQYTKEKKENK